MAFNASGVQSVHLEITSRCNAACPMCARNVLGGKDNPQLPLTDLSLDDCKSIFPPDFVRQLKKLFMCGNYGDPVAAPQTLDVYRYLREHNPGIRLGMNTNGSARSAKWWSELGAVLSKEHDYVKFGLDGLADTNHIYRRNTNFEKIMDNADAFIAAGGKAHWEFIVFRHNEHQVDEARALASSMGFTNFQVKKTGRFFSNEQMQGKDAQVVLDRDGNTLYEIEKPDNVSYHNTALQKEQALTARYGSLDAYLDQTPIICKTAAERSIYVSAEGLVFPCCWTGNQLYLWYFKERGAPIWKVIDAVGGKDAINAKTNDIRGIVDGPFFDAIAESWGQISVAGGRLKVCAKTCGTEFDQFTAQFQG
jgi:MoaA/NifB/PqqE/SkfB family radical SAM enzyme